MFREKFANDRMPASQAPRDIVWHTLDLNTSPYLPFEDGFFNVVTMLAVVEHLNADSLVDLFRETRRVLSHQGLVILTTPAAWSDRLLRLMARLRLVSKEEIDEHEYAYTLPQLGWYFGVAGFIRQRLQFGYFELGFNMWAIAER